MLKKLLLHTGKKLVLYAAQKKITVIMAKYPPRTTPVAKISANFQLSGCGDGFTLSFEIVIMVPIHVKRLRLLGNLICYLNLKCV